MKKIVYLCGIFLSIVVKISAQQNQEFKKVQYPDGYTEQLNVEYTNVGNWVGKMDLYLPSPESGPSPVIINIHGGGWNKGSKESQTGFNTFFKQGFAVANIAYRLSQVATAPAAIEDTRCALVYLINNAEKLNIDVDRMVIMGGSAGGHLALMGGLLGADTRFDTNCQYDGKVQVAAIINKYGVSEVPAWKSKSATQWLGARAGDPQFAASVSPINYVGKDNPPVFIVHGDADPIVPYQQSVDLKEKLDQAGVRNKFITVEGGLHGKFDREKNREINEEIVYFLQDIGVIK